MPDSVSEHLSRLPRLCKADLQALWRQFFKVARPCQDSLGITPNLPTRSASSLLLSFLGACFHDSPQLT